MSTSNQSVLVSTCTSRAKYYGTMATKRLKALHYGNIAAVTIEAKKKVSLDLVDRITASIFRKLVAACVQDLALVACEQELRNSAVKIVGPVVVGKKVRRRRQAYVMPLPISAIRPAVDSNEGFSSRAKYYGAMAAKRLKALHYCNIAAVTIEAKKKISSDLVDRITGLIFRRLVAACAQDLALAARELDLPRQSSAVETVDPDKLLKKRHDIKCLRQVDPWIQTTRAAPAVQNLTSLLP
eukprot:XP_016661438.1 PREDICTED: uncharacterized protein LOC107884257 [Acyrthosiphon pisum]